MEAYVLGDTKMNGQPGERHDISVSPLKVEEDTIFVLMTTGNLIQTL